MPVAAVALAGGESRRMGVDKLSLRFGEESMLGRICRLLAPVGNHTIVVLARDQPEPPLPDEISFARDALSFAGPLAGLVAGLGRARELGCEYCFACGCDNPLLEPALARMLLDRVVGFEVCAPVVAGAPQPLFAVYETRLVGQLETCPELAGKGPIALVDRFRSQLVAEDELRAYDPRLNSFLNVNTPEEYRRALSLAGFDA